MPAGNNLVFEYTYSKEDYLNALELQTINSRKSTWMLRLFGILAAGCAVYISVSTLRGMFFTDDVVSYMASLATVAALLLRYDRRLIPRLLFEYRLKTGGVPQGLIGRHTVEVGEDVLTFSYADTEHKISYGNLVRVNYNDDTILFYTGTSAVEAVPIRAFGLADERARVFKAIEERVKLAKTSKNPQKALPYIEPYREDGLRAVEYTVSPEGFFHCNNVHIRYLRRRGLKKPFALFWAVVIMTVALGSIQGIALRFQGITPQMWIVTVYYAAGLIVSLAGAVIMIRPAWLINFGFQQRMRMGQYPPGFFDTRRLQWSREWVAFQYGLMGAKFPWSAFTDILADEEYVYLYQDDNLVIFIPKAVLEEDGTFPAAKQI